MRLGPRLGRESQRLAGPEALGERLLRHLGAREMTRNDAKWLWLVDVAVPKTPRSSTLVAGAKGGPPVLDG